jgi:hypothetical protein
MRKHAFTETKRLLTLALLIGALLFALHPHARSQTVTVTADFHSPGVRVPSTFLGFSFEANRIDGQYLAASSSSLINLIAALGDGNLRIGANASDNPDTAAIAPDKLASFAGFVRAINARANWPVIYGLNLGSGTKQQAVVTAQRVAGLLGNRLIAFQFGNEPDAFNGRHFRSRYGSLEYIAEFRDWRNAVSSVVEGAQFGAPDVSNDTSWIGHVERNVQNLAFISHHFYNQGSWGSAWDNLHNLITNGQDNLVYRLGIIRQQNFRNFPLRMTEMNSSYGGGQDGVGNTYGAALWLARSLYTLAQAGFEGVNVHTDNPSKYSPILRDANGVFQAQPVYYAMRLFGLYGKGSFCPVKTSGSAPDLLSYALVSDVGWWRLVFVNSSLTGAASVRLPAYTNNLPLSVNTLSAPAINYRGALWNNVQLTGSGDALAHLRSDARGQSLINVPPVSVVVVEMH